MTAIHLPGSLGQRLKHARLYSPSGRPWPNPLSLEDVRRALQKHNVSIPECDLAALENDTYAGQISAIALLALSRVLGCRFLYLIGVEDG